MFSCLFSLGRVADCLSFCISLLSFTCELLGKARRGQRELPLAAGGLREVAADGGRRMGQDCTQYRHDPTGSHVISESSTTRPFQSTIEYFRH